MTCSVRILSTISADSSPSILLVAPNGSKTLINCGEGCQRIFLEFGQKLSTVNRVCLTHLSHTTLGGLPGMILTSADVMATSAVATAKQNALHAIEIGSGKSPKRSIPPSDELPGLDLVGPDGTTAYINSLRHFMRRDAFSLRVHCGNYSSSNQEQRKRSNKSRRRKSSSDHSQGAEMDFHVQSIVCETGRNRQILSYIFTTPPIKGKFLLEKAIALGIPKGPLYGQLKAGKVIVFKDPKTGKDRQVQGSEMVEPGLPGIAVAVLCYSDNEMLDMLISSESLSSLLTSNTKEKSIKTSRAILDIIVHFTNKDFFHSPECTNWRNTLDATVQHVFLDTELPTPLADPGTPYHSAAAGAVCHSKLMSNIFLAPAWTPEEADDEMIDPHCRTIPAVPLLEYTLIPRSRKGFEGFNTFKRHQMSAVSELVDFCEKTGAIEVAGKIKQKIKKSIEATAELIFTGTGSAIPCKHRNVSGIYLQMKNKNSILLDVGEGTLGQLIRAKPNEDFKDILRRIRAVWISHPHADHHLGLLSLLAERRRMLQNSEEPVVVIAPPSIRRFLNEYECVVENVAGSYIFLECQLLTRQSLTDPMMGQVQLDILRRLNSELGITHICSTPVQHCAHSYAVTLHGTAFGILAYSGDCRPSRAFAEDAKGADILIHEATFTDGMEAEAALKRHSTVGEALEIAKMMCAKSVVLSHFSQRFPKIPPMKKRLDKAFAEVPIVFAFDYMRLTPETVVTASQLTPALRLLYPEESPIPEEDNDGVIDTATLDIPGLFAQSQVL